jgi:O-methyltransferase
MTSPKIPSLFAGISGPQDKKEELIKLLERLGQVLQGLDPYLTDNIITFGKNLSFLQDKRLTDLVFQHAVHEYDKAIIWRTHILTWAAQNAIRVAGDLVECGTHLGFSVKVISDYVELVKTGRRYWCFDIFEGSAYDSFDLKGLTPFEWVSKEFQDKEFVRLVKGNVPDSFEDQCPEKVAFLHLDLNSALAEEGALQRIVPLMPAGAIVVLDDYGWSNYKAQKVVADKYFAQRNIPIVELPTGQGLVIIR